jgi:transcriptional regulator with XRE-family HTH domain
MSIVFHVFNTLRLCHVSSKIFSIQSKRVKMDDLLKKVGAKIREERKKLNLSQDDLADRANLHPTYVGGIERGERNPTIISLGKIANALNMPLFQLLRFNHNDNLDADAQTVISEMADLYRSQNFNTKQIIKKVVAVIGEELKK